MDDLTRRAIAQWTTAQPAVSAFLRALVPDAAEREDLLQGVAVAVIESFDRFDPDRPFLPWVLGVARHHVTDALRRTRRAPTLVDPESLDALTDAIARVAHGEQAMLGHLATCLERLDARAREICDLRYRRDLAPQRIAEILGMQPNTVAKALQRIREQLRACMQARLGEAEFRS